MCSIHLDDATAAIVRQNAHHTPATGGEETVMKPISVWGWLGGHYGQRPVGEFGQDAGVTPLLFFEGHPRIINNHRESGPRFNVSYEGRAFYSIVSPSLYRGIRTHTNTSSSSNLVFPWGLPSRYWPSQPCLASVGNRSLATGWYGFYRTWKWELCRAETCKNICAELHQVYVRAHCF